MGCATRASKVALVAALAGCSANDDVPSPVVNTVTPDHGPAGLVVQISGSYFCQVPDIEPDDPCDIAGTVEFGTVPGTPTLWSDDAIMAEVPAGLSTPVTLRVVAGAHRSNGVTFTPSS